MSKQTSIDFLIEQIEIILKLNNIKLNPEYTFHTILPIIEKLKAMHKEEIEHAYEQGEEDAYWHPEIGYSRKYKDSEQYYNEIYGDEKEVL